MTFRIGQKLMLTRFNMVKFTCCAPKDNFLPLFSNTDNHYFMERHFNKNELYPDCPIRNILNRISDKWTLLVLYTLNGHESLRFKDISAELQDISHKMLVLTLRTLETDGFVERQVFAEVPARVEYRLTERSRSLFPIINQLIQWAKDHMDEILLDRTKALSKRK